ncbi:Sigma-70 region 2 domain protein [metagenome]|uniref:Sigma-70 region 2 domain protein n=1 Tax=metagenome TaxID=256318 RepID=A0A2P2BYK0_9ZZZZ
MTADDQAPTPDEIDALAVAARDGDGQALEDLIRLLRPKVLNICRGVLPHHPDAEDACQEALINISAKIGTFRGTSRFTTWVHTVAVNSARSTYRRMKNQAAPGGAADDLFLERPDPRTTSVIAGTRLDLLEAMDILERDHPSFVTPLLLRDVYGLSYEEIAAETAAPLGTVKSRVHDGRRLVRPLLRVTE